MELLEKNGSVSIHMRNIQYLAIEMFRVSKNLSQPIMIYIFKENNQSCYNRIKTCEFSRLLAKSLYRASKSVLFLEPTKWNMALDDYKDIDNVNTYKNKIKQRNPENCLCRLYKIYLSNKGFV